MEVPPGIKRTAAMVVLKSGSEFLLLKRWKAPNKGCYVPVGGKVDPHERPMDTALRETAEETGIQLNRADIKYGGILVESAPNNYNWVCFIYIAEIDKVPPPLCDEGELAWIPYEGIPNIPTPPTDLQIYLYLKDQIPFALDAQYDENMQLIDMYEEISGQSVFPV